LKQDYGYEYELSPWNYKDGKPKSSNVNALDNVEVKVPDRNKNSTHPTEPTQLQLILDLLSTTGTRRYLRPYLPSINVSVKCALSPLYENFLYPNTKNAISIDTEESAQLFVQLVTMLQESETFGVQDLTAAPLFSAQMACMYHKRAHILLKMAHQYYPDKLSDPIYAGVGIVCDEAFF